MQIGNTVKDIIKICKIVCFNKLIFVLNIKELLEEIGPTIPDKIKLINAIFTSFEYSILIKLRAIKEILLLPAIIELIIEITTDIVTPNGNPIL